MAGADKLSPLDRKTGFPLFVSGRLGRGGPCGFGMAAQDAKARSGNQVGLEVEGVVDRSVGGEESLG